MMSIRTGVFRGLSLLSVGLMDFGTPFIRMLILVRMLDLNELGFASALAATYGTFEQVTDIAIYRFVVSTARVDFSEALACAHALSVLRGFVVGIAALLLAPGIAYLFSLDRDWGSFAVLAAIIFGRSLEHLEPRVSERDYRYGAQIKISMISNFLGLFALAATAFISHSHNAVIAFLLAQMLAIVGASHFFSQQPYHLRFRSPYLKRAWAYSYPLIFNGIGLAIGAQGDRFVVGALLGLPALGLYSVAMLASITPTSLVFKVMTTINLAALHNASEKAAQFSARLRFYARATPLIAGGYAMGLLAIMNLTISFAFGSKFVVNNWILIVLALGAFFKIVRTEPFTSLFLHEMKTAKLALTNLSPFSGLSVGYYFGNRLSIALGTSNGSTDGGDRRAFDGALCVAEDIPHSVS